MLWTLVLYLFISLTVEVVSEHFANLPSISNAILNIYTVIEFSLISSVYFQYNKSKKFRVLILVIASIFLLCTAKRYFLDAALQNTDSFISSIEAICMVLITGITFYQMVIDDNLSDLGGYYFFWINTGFMLYFAGALILFKSSDFIERASKNIGFALWGLHQLFNTSTNILLAIGLWKVRPASR